MLAADIVKIQTALTQLVDALVAATTPPLPISYSIEGQSVSYSDYISWLVKGIKELHELLISLEVYEIRSSVL